MHFHDTTLLIIGHGSTANGDSGATVYQHAAELRRRGLFADVREAFFKIEPCIGPALAAIRTPRVFVVPFFTAEGYFTRQAIPCELGLPAGAQDTMPCRVQLGTLAVTYCLPVGTHPSMTGIILARATAALAGARDMKRAREEAAQEAPSTNPEVWPDTALVLAGHGTALNPDSRKAIERQVALIAGRNLFAEVRPAFLEEEPKIEDICDAVGSARIVVVPFFLSDGLHVSEDIPKRLGESAERIQQRLRAGKWPWQNPTQRAGKTVFYTRGVGSEASMADIILDCVRAGDTMA